MPKKLTQAEVVKELDERLKRLENKPPYRSNFEDMWVGRDQRDVDAMHSMLEDYSPQPATPTLSVIAVVFAILAMLGVVFNLLHHNDDYEKSRADVAQLQKDNAQLRTDLREDLDEFRKELPAKPVEHTIEVRVKGAVCWIGTTDSQGEVQGGYGGGGWVTDGWIRTVTSPIEVRDGCPGRVTFKVDGVEMHPTNHSGTPDQSEVVTLP